MRDLLAVAWQQRRASDAGSGSMPSRRRNRRRGSRIAAGAVLFLAGLAFGALPFVGDWSGKKTRNLTHEQRMRLVRDEGRGDNQVVTLMSVLSAQARRGLTAIADLESKRGDPLPLVKSAIHRIETVLASGKPDRSQAERYPAWIDFDFALDEIRASKINGQKLADCLEVVVYNIEETAVLFDGKKRMAGVVGEVARRALSKLRTDFSTR